MTQLGSKPPMEIADESIDDFCPSPTRRPCMGTSWLGAHG